MPLHRDAGADEAHLDTRGRDLAAAEIPKFRLADEGIGAEDASTLIRGELLLDGSARLNLATFVTTWMEPQAKALMADVLDKNIVDKDEYPQTAELERRCVSILGDLWNAPNPGEVVGCSTTGSSEACMLAGLALLRRWRHRREAAGLPTDRPNLVIGANAQVCWDKFCRYWDVEPRLVPVPEDGTHLTAAAAAAATDDRTIAVVAILGSTFDGAYEPVAEISAALDALATSGGPDVPMHVDGASGGFVAPFLDPDLVWDFRLPRVQSINASGHKYGLVYPGIGWALWRNHEALPEELVFHVDYLGGDMPTFALNFSRPGAHVVAQYFTFLRLGRAGFTSVQQRSRDTADWIAEQIDAMPELELVSTGPGIPVVAFMAADPAAVDVHEISYRLRARGWQVPAYRLPPDRHETHVLRIVVRHEFSRDLAELLIADLRATFDGDGRCAPSFHH